MMRDSQSVETPPVRDVSEDGVAVDRAEPKSARRFRVLRVSTRRPGTRRIGRWDPPPKPLRD